MNHQILIFSFFELKDENLKMLVGFEPLQSNFIFVEIQISFSLVRKDKILIAFCVDILFSLSKHQIFIIYNIPKIGRRSHVRIVVYFNIFVIIKLTFFAYVNKFW